MSAFYREKVLSVQHWTDTLFSFRATRDSGFRFQNGQFAMIGLEVEGKPLLRAYSMASANHEEELEFFSVKVADGPLTSKLQKIREGDTILVGRKATGTLVTDNLLPGKRLLLLSTGTGLAPFASLIKDPDVYERFETIVLVHGCRQVSELAYGEKRRLEIGLALANSPSLLLLDEPLAGMSPRERVETVKLLKSISKGRTMIIIDHDMDSLFELVERVTVLQEGRVLVEGTPEEIKSNPVVQEAYLGGVM